MKLLGVKKITGKIIVQTGLHIGGDSKTMEIGGMDNPIIRNPATGEPYIPGSSLKGKMRALYEMETGRYRSNGDCCNCGKPDCPVCVVFGSANNGDKSNNGQDVSKLKGPTRLIVRDSFLSEEYKDMSDEEKYQLLASEGMLIKRPMVVDGDMVLIGFNEKEWEEYFCSGGNA